MTLIALSRPQFLPHKLRNLRSLPATTSTRKRNLASHAPEFRIPVIDFNKYQRACSAGQKQETADEIVGAFKCAGFLYLANHGIPEPVIQNVYAKVLCLQILSF